MIAIIDYGMGNLGSVQKAFAAVNNQAVLTNDATVISNAAAIVLPGVGAFREAMHNLEELGLVELLKAQVQSGKPFLGICLGLQLLFETSEEDGYTPGLGILPGRIVRFPGGLKVPQIGWNKVEFDRNCPLFDGLAADPYFYFVHSYFLETDAPIVVGVTEYGCKFPSVVWKDNIYATQFHPEKSGRAGLQILANFGRIVRDGYLSGNRLTESKMCTLGGR